MAFLLNNQSVAMIPAAGFGTRLGEVTKTKPKPLVKIDGITMLERACINLIESGFKRIAINTHYLAEQIHDEVDVLKKKFISIDFYISHEPKILDIGGGIKKVMHDLSLEELLVYNSDALFFGAINPLDKLLKAWDEGKMDALFYLKEIDPMYQKGDFKWEADTRISRANSANNYLFCGIAIYRAPPVLNIHAEEFHIMKEYVFPKLEGDHKFYGIELANEFMDIGTLDNLEIAKNILNREK
ncbi:MAG: Nucleotidyl transferase superfamily protein [Candidatus Midichloriaceae bacterium]|jgi:MurNAc alpha-1-phosphate uridylyltransferase|nr:Nucleotidyl transferase superfamily protein [Candidatus Midichloriaceae bacterium]